MAKPGQEETTDINRQSSSASTSSASTSSPSTSSSNPFGSREFQQAGRSAQSAARNAQAGAQSAQAGVQSATSEFLSGTMFRPYADLLGEMESATRQWADGVRTSVEQTLNMASKMNETVITEAKRTSDFYLRMVETGASMQRSMLGNAENWMQRQNSAIQRSQQAAE
jgi:hypothetical protein